MITEQNRNKLYLLPLLRGDVIRLQWIPKFKNEGKLMWDGEKLIKLDYTLEDDGTIPKVFSFPEFPLEHFTDSIDNNSVIWLSQTTSEEAIKNFDEKTQKSFITDLYDSYVVKIGSIKNVTRDLFAKYIKKNPFIDEGHCNKEPNVYVIGGSLAFGCEPQNFLSESEDESDSE